MKILIVEDILLTAMTVRNTLENSGYTVTSIARTRADARQSVLTNPPDLALIDVKLEGSDGDGVATARELISLHPMPFIYLTANSELSQFREAQNTQPAAYLLKPFNETELLYNVELAYHNFQLKNRPARLDGTVMLPSQGGLEMVSLDQVMYLKAGGSYAEVIMTDGTRHLVSTGLGQLENYFKHQNFFRLSRSYIINLNHIKRLKDNDLLLIDGLTNLAIPDINKKELLSRLNIVRTKIPKN